MARFKTVAVGDGFTEHAGLELRVGQRVRCTSEWGPNAGCLADITSLKPASHLSDVVEVVVLVHTGTEEKPSSRKVTLFFNVTSPTARADTEKYLERVRGHPYIPGFDPPRAMGSRKQKSSTTAVPAVPPTVPPTSKGTPMTSTATKHDAIASAIAEVVADIVPSKQELENFAIDAANGAVDDAFDMHVEPRLSKMESSLIKQLADVETREELMVKAVMDAIASGGKPMQNALRRTVAATSPNKEATKSGNVIRDSLSKFYIPGEEAPANVLVASPPSFGKSYSIRLLGQEYDVFLEHGCSDDMDEISTLLGSPIPDGKGNFIVVDGVLTEAVRAASLGKTVLLLLDEVLRLTPRAQEWLLTFLTGVKQSDGTRTYRLRTRKAMPDGTLEVIECKTSNLHIVAATNLSILNPIEAFWSRWETVRVEFTMEQAQATAQAILDSYEVRDDDRKLAKAWSFIVKESRDRVSKGELRFPVDFRILERAAAMNVGEHAGVVARFAMDRIADNCANWNPDTGDMEATGAAVVVAWNKRLETLANEVQRVMDEEADAKAQKEK